MSIIVNVLFVFIGCGIDNIFYEYIIQIDPNSGIWVSFYQYLFMTLIDYKQFFKQNKSLLKWHFLLAFIAWIISLIHSNISTFDISFPIHMLFKTLSLPVSLMLGILIFKKSVRLFKTVGVFLVSLGLLCVFYADLQLEYSSKKIFGVFQIGLATFLATNLGYLQEWGFDNNPKESKFYINFFSIFFFGLTFKSIFVYKPMICWIYLIGCIVGKYIGLIGIYNLLNNKRNGPLTMTLVITVRKFFSILFSVYWFKNAWSFNHTFGFIFVVLGSLFYFL